MFSRGKMRRGVKKSAKIVRNLGFSCKKMPRTLGALQFFALVSQFFHTFFTHCSHFVRILFWEKQYLSENPASSAWKMQKKGKKSVKTIVKSRRGPEPCREAIYTLFTLHAHLICTLFALLCPLNPFHLHFICTFFALYLHFNHTFYPGSPQAYTLFALHVHCVCK